MKLTELKNIGGRTAQWLKDIGIDSVERLAERDVFEVWTELKRIHPNQVTLNALWALEGAVLDLDWRDLPPQRKHNLLTQYHRWRKNPQNLT